MKSATCQRSDLRLVAVWQSVRKLTHMQVDNFEGKRNPFSRLKLVFLWVLKLLAVYVVCRLTIAIAIPAIFLDHDWILAFKMQCLQRADICLAVEVQDAVVGNLWWGKAFYFKVRPGMEAQMRAFVTRDLPDSKIERFLTPYNYVGVAFESPEPSAPLR